MNKDSILQRIRGPEDLSDLSYKELASLAEEIRQKIILSVSKNGGHLASNLGVVELTIALHRIFKSPQDKIVWDVGHQCYAHKMLTGRLEDFGKLRRSGGLSGFPKITESVHDSFNTGHASTSISAALGLLAGDRLLGGHHVAVAVIGDGALTGGMAYEALSHAGQLGLPLIVVLNDNNMSISPNVGALSKYLSSLTMKSRYQDVRRRLDRLMKEIPLAGPFVFDTVMRLKKGVKAVFYPDNFFVDLGFEYVGPIDGHHIQRLEEVFRDVRQLGRPVVVHVMTQKGKGYQLAEYDPSAFHGVAPFSINDGLLEREGPVSFTEAFGRSMVTLGNENPKVVAITAAMEKGTGLGPFKATFKNRFFDVGIAEGHGITFSAGLAAQGLRPVTAIYSTFIQRSVDQVIHDVAIQNLPVTIALDRSGFVGDDGETHQGLFDIALFRSVPNLTFMAPASAYELELMFRWAVAFTGPCVIRYPKASCPHEIAAFSQELTLGRGIFVRESGAPLCIAFTGSLYPQVAEAADLLASQGIQTDLYNLRFIKPMDEDYLVDVMRGYDHFVVVEEASQKGGVGEYIKNIAANRVPSLPVLHLGAPETFYSQGTRSELLQRAGLDGPGIASSIEASYRILGRITLVRTLAR
jgi:1-deoxy-D-xylulose-5-phosphate synthase